MEALHCVMTIAIAVAVAVAIAIAVAIAVAIAIAWSEKVKFSLVVGRKKEKYKDYQMALESLETKLSKKQQE